MVRKINLKESEKPNISISEAKKIAKELLTEQIKNTGYSLERYEDFTVEDIDLVNKYIYQYGKSALKAIGIQW